MLKVLVVCENKMETGRLLKMTAEPVFRKMCLEYQISLCRIQEARKAAAGHDIIFCPEPVAEKLAAAVSPKTWVVGMQNGLNATEVKTGVRAYLLNKS